jgi:hypothetical protein
MHVDSIHMVIATAVECPSRAQADEALSRARDRHASAHVWESPLNKCRSKTSRRRRVALHYLARNLQVYEDGGIARASIFATRLMPVGLRPLPSAA